ncbi:hypothetical protein [Mucilaginibacter celer]|uniref:Barstar (barnase inhibitor) domain-containing protein n=1 Tax=Mucilaginibacter celer TaxID=2305508 RepID=A0A494VR79_9SPHI|nr:hypothetical protein [Mucilaginibacter celer]AYL93833.1 hypothetical protein HYN43_000320 [Mucilaginibacter celer]
MLKVSLSIGNHKLIDCQYVYLEPFASDSLRKFTFYGIKSSNKDLLYAIETCEISANDSIEVKIQSQKKTKKRFLVNKFKIYINDFEVFKGNSWWVSGLIYDDHFEAYQQGVIDILNLWKKNEDLNWAEIPNGSSLKSNYFQCCFLYSSLSTNIVKRDYYKFDMSLIQSFEDFIYFASKEFTGDKGYFGRDRYTFKDCLLEVYHNGDLKEQRQIVFFNIKKMKDLGTVEILSEIKEVLRPFNFSIKELR